MDQARQLYPCIKVGDGEIAPRVLTCGDPARAEAIAATLDDSRCLARNREFWTFSGSHRGTPVTVTSHGVGCGGAVIAFESLIRAGAKVIIRVGTCGGLRPEVGVGDIIVATAACREDGVTDKLILPSYPAAADVETVLALKNAAARLGTEIKSGVVLTQGLFYPGLLPSRLELFARAGVLAMENEIAGLFVVAGIRGVKAGAIVTADAPAFGLVDVDGYQPDEAALKRAVEREIAVALDAIVEVEV